MSISEYELLSSVVAVRQMADTSGVAREGTILRDVLRWRHINVAADKLPNANCSDYVQTLMIYLKSRYDMSAEDMRRRDVLFVDNGDGHSLLEVKGFKDAHDNYYGQWAMLDPTFGLVIRRNSAILGVNQLREFFLEQEYGRKDHGRGIKSSVCALMPKTEALLSTYHHDYPLMFLGITINDPEPNAGTFSPTKHLVEEAFDDLGSGTFRFTLRSVPKATLVVASENKNSIALESDKSLRNDRGMFLCPDSSTKQIYVTPARALVKGGKLIWSSNANNNRLYRFARYCFA